MRCKFLDDTEETTDEHVKKLMDERKSRWKT